MQKVWLTIAAIFGLLVGVFISFEKPQLMARSEYSPLVNDRTGKLLRAFTATDGRWRLQVSANQVDPLYLSMLIAYEDKRFHSHYGVDPLAFGRTLTEFAINRRVVSGGSTLTMQVARLNSGENTRGVFGKFKQIIAAIRLEKHYSKTDILENYLTLAPFGGNIEGVRAASLSYFGKEPLRLSPAEAALLIAIPQSPEGRRPDRVNNKLLVARNFVLKRAYENNLLSNYEYDAAQNEALPTIRHAFPLWAAHYSQKAKQASAEKTIKTSLDLRFQSALEGLVKEHMSSFEKGVTAALVVIDNQTGETRASVSGADYFNVTTAGQFDLTHAIRSPGSALKPFIYGMAFDLGLAHPETQLEDRPIRFGLWAPENFDHGFTGIVTARVALQQSLNLPAVDLLAKIGSNRFLSTLKAAGLKPYLPKSNEQVGLAVGLGGVGVTLADLTKAFSKIAKGGDGLLSTESAWYVADILKNAPPPAFHSLGQLAFKTGTSYGYRDAWAIGFDKKHTIGVWVGRPDNASVNGLVGRLVAAPLLFDAFKRIGRDPSPFVKPHEALVAKTMQLPAPLRGVSKDKNELRLLFPQDGIKIDLQNAESQIPLKITGGVAPYFYLVDDTPIQDKTARRVAQWQPKSAGFSRISVIDAAGKSATATVRVLFNP